MPATAPARRSRPSMIAASSSTCPSAVSTLPRPALNARIFLQHPRRRLDRVERASARRQDRLAGIERRVEPGARRVFLFGRQASSGRIAPQPPWIISVQVIARP